MQFILGLVQSSWQEGLLLAHRWVELGLVPLVGRATSGTVFIGQLFSQDLSRLSVAEWSCAPALLVGWLEVS